MTRDSRLILRVRIIGLAALLLRCPLLRAADEPAPVADAARPPWLARIAPTRPGKFPPIRPVKIQYRFGWEGISAAHGTLEFSRPKPGISQADLEAHTTGLSRRLWRMDTRTLEWCDAITLRPIHVRQAEWYRGSSSLIAQEFSPREVLRAKGLIKDRLDPAFFADMPLDEDRMRELTHAVPKRVKVPGLFDLQSGLLFVRSQPLNKGDVIHVAVIQGKSPYFARIRVLGRESVTVAAGTFPAIKLELTLLDITDSLTLAPQKRFQRAVGWFSDDTNRFILKLQTAIFIGSVGLEMEKFEFKDRSSTRRLDDRQFAQKARSSP